MNKNFIFLLAFSLLLCSNALHAQDMVDENDSRAEHQIAADMLAERAVSVERGDRVLQPNPTNPANPATPVQVQFIQLAADGTFDAYTFPNRERRYFPRFAVKANLLYGATTTVNLGAEFLLNRFLTLDISGGWNPFVHRENKKFAHWMVQPTLRYWIQEPFNGHFIGASLMYVDFNIGGIELPLNLLPALPDRRFRGNAYSASFQYGHQWILSPRWSLEASLNVGYMFLDYGEYVSGWCGDRIGRDNRHYFGITNAAISIIYIIR